ncbi:MAG: hypothetical protein KF878_38240, partial [Planctomycetes bacterium]|nr:hypothetical protein [Planctomycetota bacterium]
RADLGPPGRGVVAAAQTPDADVLWLLARDGALVRVADGAARVVAAAPGEGWLGREVVCSADGRRAVRWLGRGNASALGWFDADGRAGEVVERDGVQALALRPDGGVAVWSTWDGELVLRDLDAGGAPAVVGGLPLHHALLFEPDGRGLVAGTARGVVLRFAVDLR